MDGHSGLTVQLWKSVADLLTRSVLSKLPSEKDIPPFCISVQLRQGFEKTATLASLGRGAGRLAGFFFFFSLILNSVQG